MRSRLSFAVLGSLMVASFDVRGAESVIARWHLEPFWEQSTMHGESLFFLEPTTGGVAVAPLLFNPIDVLAVVNTATGTTFKQGQDYVIDKKNKRLVLTEESRIPFTTRADFEPALGVSGQLFRDETRDIFFGEGAYFHSRQVEVTYTHHVEEWATMGGAKPKAVPELLPKVMKKLAAKESVTICLLGDSISAGLNASSTSDVAPQTPPYGTLFSDALAERFGSEVRYTNFSVSGMSTPWGIDQAPVVAAKQPDLVIIAFGMNDASGHLAPAQFRANIEAIMAGIRADHSEVAFILVASMRGNRDWKHAAPEYYPQYRDALMTLQGPGVAVADLTAFWTTLLAHKKFADITGNGVNHPNDFGHRVYAQVLLALFGKGSME